MPKYERDIVIARPGTYQYSWGEMEKTAEDLSQIPAYSPTIKLTLGHPQGGRTKRRDLLGYVKPLWDEKNQILRGKAWFYQEHFHKIPDEIARNIINDVPTEISASFTLDEEEKSFETGVQEGTFIDHIAVLREGEDPICPLGKCGINVVLQESEILPKLLYEQSQPSKDPEDEKEETVAEAPVEVDEIAALKAEVAELTKQLESSKDQEESSEPESEFEKEPEPVAEPKDEPAPEPEFIPPSNITADSEGLTFNEDGELEIIVQPKKSVGLK